MYKKYYFNHKKTKQKLLDYYCICTQFCEYAIVLLLDDPLMSFPVCLVDEAPE